MNIGRNVVVALKSGQVENPINPTGDYGPGANNSTTSKSQGVVTPTCAILIAGDTACECPPKTACDCVTTLLNHR